MTDLAYSITPDNTRYTQGSYQTWRAFTSFPLDPLKPDEIMIVFRTDKEPTGIITRCKVIATNQTKIYVRQIARHHGIRATRANIEDAHQAASCEFADHVRYAQAFYWT